MSKRYVTLGCGRRVTLGSYTEAWRRVKRTTRQMVGDRYQGLRGWGDIGLTRKELLRQFREGMHDRINGHDPSHGRGRKWSSQWQGEAIRTARAVNTPRLIVRWVPVGFRARLVHRIWSE